LPAEYRFQLIEGVPVLTAPAEIDTTTSVELRAVLSRWCRRGHATVVVDLAGTVFCDLAGLRELALAHKRAQAAGGGLRLVTPAGGAFPRIFTLTGLDGAIPHFATIEQALAEVSVATAGLPRRGPARESAAPASPPAHRGPGCGPVAPGEAEAPGLGEVFETSDIQAAERVLSDAYGNMRITARGQRRGMRLSQVSLTPAVRFDHVTFAMSFDATADPPGALVFGELKSGLARYGSDGSDRHCRPGDVYMPARPEHPYTATIEDTEAELAVIDPALLAQLASAESGYTRQPLQFTGYQPVSLQAAQQWRATYAYVRDTVLAAPDAAAHPLIAGSAARLLAATALAVFPSTALTGPATEDHRDANPAALRRAVAFIDENAHLDITVADIAAAVPVTVRAIQLAFQRHMGTTPTRYLRQVRLARAHADLTRASPGDSLTVTTVAYRWGFPSLSRFAAQYRHAYGVSPSRVLRQ
jgi:anti-anti-sigma factor